jgi:hypothetical protein
MLTFEPRRRRGPLATWIPALRASGGSSRQWSEHWFAKRLVAPFRPSVFDQHVATFAKHSDPESRRPGARLGYARLLIAAIVVFAAATVIGSGAPAARARVEQTTSGARHGVQKASTREREPAMPRKVRSGHGESMETHRRRSQLMTG